jgi:hypothetical protein
MPFQHPGIIRANYPKLYEKIVIKAALQLGSVGVDSRF